MRSLTLTLGLALLSQCIATACGPSWLEGGDNFCDMARCPGECIRDVELCMPEMACDAAADYLDACLGWAHDSREVATTEAGAAVALRIYEANVRACRANALDIEKACHE